MFTKECLDLRNEANTTPNRIFQDNQTIEFFGVLDVSREFAMTRAVEEPLGVLIDEIFDEHGEAWRRLADL